MTFLYLLLSFWMNFSFAEAPPRIELPGASSKPEAAKTPAAASAGSSSRWLERFDEPAGTKLDSLGWKGGNPRDGHEDFVLLSEAGSSFLRSQYKPPAEAKYLFKEIEWDAREMPIFRWKWRVKKFPVNAKVLDKKVSDAGAQVYVLWKIGRRSAVLKYFWSENEKVGEELKQSSIIFGKLRGEIVRNGGPLNTWQTETRNLVEDYKKAFGEEPSVNARGIAVLSDGDETESESIADYKDFEVLKAPAK